MYNSFLSSGKISFQKKSPWKFRYVDNVNTVGNVNIVDIVDIVDVVVIVEIVDISLKIVKKNIVSLSL